MITERQMRTSDVSTCEMQERNRLDVVRCDDVSKEGSESGCTWNSENKVTRREVMARVRSAHSG